jgi:hypothetical protein
MNPKLCFVVGIVFCQNVDVVDGFTFPASCARLKNAALSTEKITTCSAGTVVTAATKDVATTGVTRNINFSKLAGGYLFPEIGRRRNAYIAANPSMADRIISLGIGDTYVER